MMNSRWLFAATLTVALLGSAALSGESGMTRSAMLNRVQVAEEVAQGTANASPLVHATYEAERSAGTAPGAASLPQ